MYEDGLGEVMLGVGAAPTVLEEDTVQMQKTQFTKRGGTLRKKTVSYPLEGYWQRWIPARSLAVSRPNS